jgi:hypothetical protein
MGAQSNWETVKRTVDVTSGLCVVATMIFIALQWREMRAGSSDTHSLAEAAKTQSEATRVIAESTRSQTANTERLARSTAEEVRRLEESVKEAHRLALAAEAANASSKDSERPWMGAYASVQDFEVGKSPVASFTLVNTGRRPANITLAEARTKNYPRFPKDPDFEISAEEPHSTVLAVPGQAVTSTLTISQLTKQQMDALTSGQEHLYLYMRVEYSDVLTHARHWTHLFWRYHPNLKTSNNGFANCLDYNEAN